MTYDTMAVRHKRTHVWGIPTAFTWAELLNTIESLPEGGQILLRNKDGTLILEKRDGEIHEAHTPF